MFPPFTLGKSYPPTPLSHAAEKTLIGVTNMPLLGVTPSKTPVTTGIRSPATIPPTAKPVPPTALPADTTSLVVEASSLVVEVSKSQPGNTGEMGETQISSDHPPTFPKSSNVEKPCNSPAKENTSVMEIS